MSHMCGTAWPWPAACRNRASPALALFRLRACPFPFVLSLGCLPGCPRILPGWQSPRGLPGLGSRSQGTRSGSRHWQPLEFLDLQHRPAIRRLQNHRYTIISVNHCNCVAKLISSRYVSARHRAAEPRRLLHRLLRPRRECLERRRQAFRGAGGAQLRPRRSDRQSRLAAPGRQHQPRHRYRCRRRPAPARQNRPPRDRNRRRLRTRHRAGRPQPVGGAGHRRGHPYPPGPRRLGCPA